MHRRLLLISVALLAGLPALAASTLTVECAEPAGVYVSDKLVNTAGEATASLKGLEAGDYAVQIRDTAGVAVWSGLVIVPMDAAVKARYSGSTGLTITSPMGRIKAPDDTRVAADDEVASTFDYNHGTSGGAQSTSSGSKYAGNSQGAQNALNTAGRVGSAVGQSVYRPSVGVNLAVTGASAAVSAGGTALRTAEAGGLDSLGRSETSFRQGRPIPPAADTGYVEFLNTDGRPSIVYLEGFTIAAFEEGETKKKVKLEVGRHKIEIWDGSTMQVHYKGMLQIDKDFTLQLQYSEADEPVAVNRSWAWSGR